MSRPLGPLCTTLLLGGAFAFTSALPAEPASGPPAPSFLVRGCREALALVTGRIERGRPDIVGMSDEKYLIEIGQMIKAVLDETVHRDYFETPLGRILGLSPWRYRTFQSVPVNQVENWLATFPRFNHDPTSANYQELWKFWKVNRPGRDYPVGFVELWTSAGKTETSYYWNLRMHHLGLVVNHVVFSKTVPVEADLEEFSL